MGGGLLFGLETFYQLCATRFGNNFLLLVGYINDFKENGCGMNRFSDDTKQWFSCL